MERLAWLAWEQIRKRKKEIALALTDQIGAISGAVGEATREDWRKKKGYTNNRNIPFTHTMEECE
jgi:hypothetical protein